MIVQIFLFNAKVFPKNIMKTLNLVLLAIIFLVSLVLLVVGLNCFKKRKFFYLLVIYKCWTIKKIFNFSPVLLKLRVTIELKKKEKSKYQALKK